MPARFSDPSALASRLRSLQTEASLVLEELLSDFSLVEAVAALHLFREGASLEAEAVHESGADETTVIRRRIRIEGVLCRGGAERHSFHFEPPLKLRASGMGRCPKCETAAVFGPMGFLAILPTSSTEARQFLIEPSASE